MNVTTPWINFLREYLRAHPPVYDGLVGRERRTANMKVMKDAGKAWQAHKLALQADGPASAPTEPAEGAEPPSMSAADSSAEATAKSITGQP